MTRRNEMFGRLLKAVISSIANIEGKAAPVVAEDLDLHKKAVRDAVEVGDQRSIIGNKNKLAAIIMEQGQLEHAEAGLTTHYVTAQQYNYRRRMAAIQLLLAQIYTLRDEMMAVTSAGDLFKSMGIRKNIE